MKCTRNQQKNYSPFKSMANGDKRTERDKFADSLTLSLSLSLCLIVGSQLYFMSVMSCQRCYSRPIHYKTLYKTDLVMYAMNKSFVSLAIRCLATVHLTATSHVQNLSSGLYNWWWQYCFVQTILASLGTGSGSGFSKLNELSILKRIPHTAFYSS